MTPEASVLLRGVRAVLRDEPLSQDGGVAVDWSLLDGLAIRHQVQALLYESIQGGPIERRIPDQVRCSLLLAYHRNGLRNRTIHERICEILGAAERRGVPVMLLKGAVLAFACYTRSEHRELGDIDILVREDNFAALRSVLAELGYATSAPPLVPRELARYAQYYRQIRFQARRVPPIEVHFRLINQGMPGRREPAWEDAEHQAFGSSSAWVPSPERFLLHLCLHAQQHGFALLRLLVDIAVWLRSRRIGTERFVELARRSHLGTAAYYSLTYASELVDCGSGPSRAPLRPAVWKRLVFERLWQDREVRSLKTTLRRSETELPRAFLLGEAPLVEKLGFLWNVGMPKIAWLDRRDQSASLRRFRHVGRLLQGARRALWG